MRYLATLPTPVGAWEWRSEHGTARAVTTDEHVAAVRAVLDRRWVLLSTETDGPPWRHLRLVQVGWGDEAWPLDPLSRRGGMLIDELCRRAQHSDLGLVGHNAAGALLSLGNHLWGPAWQALSDAAPLTPHYAWIEKMAAADQVRDTMVGARVLWTAGTPLASVADRRSDMSLETVADRCGLPHVPVEWAERLRWAAHDIWQLRAAHDGLRDIGAWEDPSTLAAIHEELLIGACRDHARNDVERQQRLEAAGRA